MLQSRRIGGASLLVFPTFGMRVMVDLRRSGARNAHLQANRQLKSQKSKEDAGQ